MRLKVFILQNMEAILVEWESFAASLVPNASTLSALLLRDHAQQILEAIVQDLSAPQSGNVPSEKSIAATGPVHGAPKTAAETHGYLRASDGFDIKQMASEYRALRASVLRLWMAECGPAGLHQDDLMRFNEAIDQALAESINFFTEKVEEQRNLFLGMLGHDMRTPVQAILMTAMLLERINAGSAVTSAARRLTDSGLRMKALLDDLTVFNRIQLGLGVAVTREAGDLAVLFKQELEQLRAAYPGRQLDLHIDGSTQGIWDGASLRRLLGNLVVNAIKYGEPSSPVTVHIKGAADCTRFEVRNQGARHDTATLRDLFDPLKQGATDSSGSAGSMGLGLYVVSQVTKAHHGELDARCENGETVFAVRLPVALA
jgi:signal transduction histidine kinase